MLLYAVLCCAVLCCGGPQVGKTTLIQSLVKHYTKQNLPDTRGPITVVSGAWPVQPWLKLELMS